VRNEELLVEKARSADALMNKEEECKARIVEY
jgi:hypothetical protein